MTCECSCGTERVYESTMDAEADIIVNIQGDEPLIKPKMIYDLLPAFADETVVMATLKKKILNREEIKQSNVVKVATDNF